MSNNDPLQWFTVEQPKGKKKLPKWIRSAAISDNGDVFAPAVFCGAEHTMLVCATFDNEPCAMLDGHTFLRTSWMKKEYPDEKELMNKIEARLKAAKDGL